MSIDAGLIANGLSLGGAVISAVAVWYAKRGAKAAEDVQANGVTHILAQTIPSTPITIPTDIQGGKATLSTVVSNVPLGVRTVIIDGITYTAKS